MVIAYSTRRVQLHVSVRRRDMSGQSEVNLRLHHPDAGGRWHDDGIGAIHVRELADHIRRDVRDERDEFLHSVRRAGTSDVAQVQGQRPESGPGGRVVGSEACGLGRGDLDGRGRRLLQRETAGASGRGRFAILVGVPATDHLEAHVDHAHVLPAAAVQRHVRANVLLHGRAPVVPGAVGRRDRVRVSGCRPRAGHRVLRGAVPNPA